MARSMLNSRSSDAGTVTPRQNNSMQAWLCQGRAAQHLATLPHRLATFITVVCTMQHEPLTATHNFCPRCRTALL